MTATLEISGARSRRRTSARSPESRARLLAICGAMLGAAIAGSIGGFNLSHAHAMFGISEYDDGAYLGAALRFVAGDLPYRDFTFVQPPGITLVLSPIALLAHLIGSDDALACARVATVVVAAVNALLCGLLVRYRGALAALVASCSLALYPAAIYAFHTLLLEPWLTFFCLLALNLAFSHGVLASRWRLSGAGLCLAAATSTKAWGVLVALVVGVVLLANWRALVRVTVGFAAGIVVFIGPFFVAAPRAFLHEVVVSQLSRQQPVATPTDIRLFNLAGLAGLNFPVTSATPGPRGLVVVVIVAALLLVATAIPAVACRNLLEVTVVGCVVVTTAMLFIPTEFYPHYVYFPIAFVAVALGLALSTISAVVRNGIARLPHLWPARTRIFAMTLCALAFASCVAAALVAELPFIDSHFGTASPGAAIARRVPKGACTLTDTEVDLIVANRVSEQPGCPTVIDATGVWISADPNHPPHSGVVVAAQVRTWKKWMSETNYIVLTSLNAFRIPWTLQLHEWVDEHFKLVAVKGAIIEIRRPKPIPWAKLPKAWKRV
jgi:alpha-1,2-mannosyltransferase